MAQPPVTSRTFLVIFVIALSGLALTTLLHRPLTILEDHTTSLRYAIRGDRVVDTNIVLIYIDNEAISSLGWPVKRNFQALMVKTLTELKAGAIGMEVQFETANAEYPEYDELLSTVLHGSPSVLASYFSVVKDSSISSSASSRSLFSYPQIQTVWTHGANIHLPLPALMMSTAGIGHVNVNENGSIPLFIAGEEGVVPAFGLEVLRVYAGLSRDALAFTGSDLRFVAAGKERRIASDGEANATLNFSSASAFRAFPFLEVLRSYDAIASGNAPSIPVSSFRDKIILVGVIAEGRSAFLATPVHPRFPSLAYHATFIDNALQSTFITTSGPVTSTLLIMLVVFLPAWAILTLRSPHAKIIVIATLLLPVIASILAFNLFAFILPVVPSFVAWLWSIATGFTYHHRVSSNHVMQLQKEKDIIIAQLKDREAKVAILERQMMSVEPERSHDRMNALMEEIRKYKNEIRSLSSRADDMDRFAPEEHESGATTFEGMVYHSQGPMKPVMEFIRKIASSGAPVLILGQSGTGKELVARAIHAQSPRASKPFVAVNCGALAETLLESELFGHERGAFTGAVTKKAGRFELANEGTIFLDEIGEVSEGFQLKLLRVLQEGELERVGGTGTIKVDVRVLAATNRNLKERVQAGKFREDLYYRLNVLTVELPSLAERREDIPHLVQHFIVREKGQGVSKNVMDAFLQYPWPGNVRELESVLTRAVLLAKAESRPVISMKDVTTEVASSFQSISALEDQVLDAIREKGFSRNSVSDTASELGGLNRGTIAEHLRGQFFKAFVENQFDVEKTLKVLSLTDEREIQERVRKRLDEYLENIAVVIDKRKPWNESRELLRPKMKNLPLRFQIYVEQTGEAYYRGLWNPTAGNA